MKPLSSRPSHVNIWPQVKEALQPVLGGSFFTAVGPSLEQAFSSVPAAASSYLLSTTPPDGRVQKLEQEVAHWKKYANLLQEKAGIPPPPKEAAVAAIPTELIAGAKYKLAGNEVELPNGNVACLVCSLRHHIAGPLTAREKFSKWLTQNEGLTKDSDARGRIRLSRSRNCSSPQL